MFRIQLSRTLAALIAFAGFTTAADAARIKLAADEDVCIHKEEAGDANGNDIHLWECNDGDEENKSWYYDESTGYIHSVAYPDKCLHKQYGNGNIDNGNPIHLWDCDDGESSNKQWTYDESTGYIMLRAATWKCMHRKYANTDNGNPIHLWDCSDGSAANKEWVFSETAEIDTSISGQCTGTNASLPNGVVSKSDSFGDSTIGASYSLRAGIDPQSDGSTWIGGRASATGTIFSKTANLLTIEASATEDGDDSSSLAYLEVVGVVLLDEPISISYGWSQEQTLVTATANFYGVNVTGKLVGTMGFDASATIEGVGLALNATPYADVTATASAGVGGGCLETGIGGDTTVLGVEVPVDGQLVLVGDDIAWSIDADFELSTLDGSLYLFVEYCLDEERYTIFEWDGFSADYSLFDASGCL